MAHLKDPQKSPEKNPDEKCYFKNGCAEGKLANHFQVFSLKYGNYCMPDRPFHNLIATKSAVRRSLCRSVVVPIDGFWGSKIVEGLVKCIKKRTTVSFLPTLFQCRSKKVKWDNYGIAGWCFTTHATSWILEWNWNFEIPNCKENKKKTVAQALKRWLLKQGVRVQAPVFAILITVALTGQILSRHATSKKRKKSLQATFPFKRHLTFWHFFYMQLQNKHARTILENGFREKRRSKKGNVFLQIDGQKLASSKSVWWGGLN